MSTPRDAAAASAGASADAAAQSAADAAASADTALKAAVAVAVAAEMVEIRKALSDLAAANAREDAQDAQDAVTITKLQTTIITLQSQNLWVAAALLLVGAAIGYVLTAVVF